MSKTYEQAIAEYGKTIVWLMELERQRCQNTIRIAPCTANPDVGLECFNCFSTCQDKPNFLEEFVFDDFCSLNQDPFAGVTMRPYIVGVSYNSTEIKDRVTTTARITVTMGDPRDNDVGLDDYIDTRSYTAEQRSTFWRKYFERYRNYKGRTVKLFQGVLGIVRGQYKERFTGIIDDVKFLNNGDVQITVLDSLVDLKDIDVPPKTNISLVSTLTDSSVEATLSTTEGLYAAPAAIAMGGQEYISYTAIDAPTNRITGLTRGFRGTTAIAHDPGAKVEPVLHKGPGNPFDIMKSLLLDDAGWPAGRVNSAAIDAARDFPGNDITVEYFSHKSQGLDKVLYPLVDLLDCSIFMAEDLSATVVRRIPNVPGRAYYSLSTEGNFQAGSDSVDLNPSSQYTSILINWDMEPFGDPSKEESFQRSQFIQDADAIAEYGYDLTYTINSAWIYNGYLQEELLKEGIYTLERRRVLRTKNAQRIISVDIDIQDSAIKTGGFARLTTNIWPNADGSDLFEVAHQVIARKPKDTGRIGIRVIELPKENICVFAAGDTPDYPDANVQERQDNGFFVGEDGTIHGDSPNVFY